MRFDRHKFFDSYRQAFGRLDQATVANLESFLAAVEADRTWDRPAVEVATRQLAYVMATAKHETGHDFQPKDEYGKGEGKDYGRPVLIARNTSRYYYGRGLIQLTWLKNYAHASLLCGVDFVFWPERVKEYPFAYTILVDGMLKGWLTGARLEQFVSERFTDYLNARRVVNGTDEAPRIDGYAMKLAVILQSSRTPNI